MQLRTYTMEKEQMGGKPHVLALPLPLQGHMNPMLQFCKRLASRGIMVTLVTTALADASVPEKINSIRVEFIENVTNEIPAADWVDGFMKLFEASVTKNLGKFIEKKASSGYPVKVVLYDSLIPWALELVKSLGFPAATFFTQACAVCAIYYHVHRGTLKVPLEKPNVALPSMPPLESKDLPSFVYDPIAYPTILDVGLSQNLSLEKADWLLFNSFEILENEVLSWMRNFYPIKTIGPTIPSMYLDKRLRDDSDYGLHLFKANKEACIKWLDSKETGSVVYASFGSFSDLQQHQMEEIAWGIIKSNFTFLWVVRDTEQSKLPSNLISEAQERGLIVGWCPQLEVLQHRAVGCFVTHCGWNSTLEALSLGVPMVTVPLWIDQPTNAKYIVDVWHAGVQVKVNEKGTIAREEVAIRIKEVMHGEKANELKRNAVKWKELAIEAMSEGGSSDKNIEEFVSSLVSLS